MIYIIWAGVLGRELKNLEIEDKDFYILLYYSCVLGYAFIFTMIMSLLKYSTIKSLDKMPHGYKIIFSVSTLIMMAFGAILIQSTSSFDVLGAVIFVIGIYALAYFWLRKWIFWANLVLGILFVVLCIAGIYYYRTNAGIVLEILSIMLFMVFVGCFSVFLKEMVEN